VTKTENDRKYVEEFEAELTRQGKSINTVKTYTRNAHLFIDWLEATTGEQFKGKISVFDGREYRAYLTTVRKQKPNTVNAKLEAVQQLVNFLQGRGEHTPIKIVRQKAVANCSVKVLDKAALYKCRRWANSYSSVRDAAIFELLVNTGLRVSELAALTTDDVQISKRKGCVIVRAGKGGKYREVPMNADARNAVQRYLDVRPRSTDTQLFLGERGPLKRGAVAKVVRKIGWKGAGEPNLSPHDLRHTCFTNMAKNGVDLKTIADLAGHSDVKLTAKYYIATTDQDREAAVEGLNL